jgi:hypothetical protein
MSKFVEAVTLSTIPIMPPPHVIIRINHGKIYFNGQLSIPVERTNLPVSKIDFQIITDVFWDLEQLEFIRPENRLRVKVTNFFPRDTESFSLQNPKSAINFLEFSDLPDVSSLHQCLNYSMKEIAHLDKAIEDAFDDFAPTSGQPKLPRFRRANTLFRSVPEKEILSRQFSIPFKDSSFKLGYVVFGHPVQETGELVRFKIRNDFLLPEFELIKSYFMKALGTRKFDVSARVTVEKGKVTAAEATSGIIDMINESLIDSIKNIRTLAITKSPFHGPIDKSLFTSDEIFDAFSPDEKEGNVFDQSEEEILKYLLEKSNVRNRRQLEYLAGQKQVPGTKLKFTLHPFFGFLFTIEGERMYHFVWELLNTHATYTWSAGKGEQELALQYRRVEDAINQVRNSGREQYKQSYRTSPLDPDLLFHVIIHEDAGSPFIDSFVKWRHRLNELLV